MKQIKAIIYDCDGVLFESRRANLAYYNRVLQHLGEPLVSPEDVERAHLCHTAASPRVFEVLLGSERMEEALSFASTLDFRQFIPCMDPEPELVPTLEALSQHFPLAVATNRGVSMPEILDHFNLAGYFRVVVTSRDVPRPKPHPDMLILAAEKLGYLATELLFVGDSSLDRDAAASAGIRFASYKGDLGANIQLHSHSQLLEMVLGTR